MERQILHVAVAAFAVAVERVVDPSLNGRPYLDVTGSERLFGRARDIATRIKEKVEEEFDVAQLVVEEARLF